MKRSLLTINLVPITLLGCCWTAGCSDSNKQPTVSQRQNAALNDPFGYGPKEGDKSTEIPSVTGGSMSQFDKSGFKRDVDRVLNP